MFSRISGRLVRGLENCPRYPPRASLKIRCWARLDFHISHPAARARTAMRDYATMQSRETLVLSDAQRKTIYALSTPPGKAGVAVIRVSGPDALQIWQTMVSVRSRKGKAKEENPEPWKMYRCEVLHPESKELLDSGLAVYFKGPRSFTGEDVIELHVHSGRAIISSILEALAYEQKCRLAEPGEFTRRAFQAGRLDLTEAEGLHDLINAETSSQRKAALQAVGGKLREHFDGLREQILRSMSLVEALIDFGEEEVEDGVYGEAKKLALEAVENIQGLLTDYRQGEILRSGIKLAIYGPPNAGKSSLLNLLARREAAIVTNIPGTTRDVLELPMDIGGLPVLVADTAGLRVTDDLVESIGVERAINVVSDADIALCVLSAAEVLDSNQTQTLENVSAIIDGGGLLAEFAPQNRILLLNKVDLLSDDDIKKLQSIAAIAQKDLGIPKTWLVSINSSVGIDTFLRELGDLLKSRYDVLDRSWDRAAPLVINARHQAHLESALQFLNAFLADPDNDIVLAAEELRYAAQAIGKISGRIDVEDILDAIFRNFCIGK